MLCSTVSFASESEDCEPYRDQDGGAYQQCIKRNQERTREKAREWARNHPNGKNDCKKERCTSGRAD